MVRVMTPRLYIKTPLAPGADVALPPETAHYLRSVLRREDGAPVRVFNANDGEFEATIGQVGKRVVALQVGARIKSPAPEPDLWLVFAVVKRAAVETIIQKATELGAARLLPVLTARTYADRLRLDRLAAIACEAAEQCGRLSVPAIEPAQKLDAVLERWEVGRRCYFCDETGGSFATDAVPGSQPQQIWGGAEGRAKPLAAALADASELAGAGISAAFLIGPEGGFAPTEIARLRGEDFITPVSLGPRILRADTAAIAALSIWQAICGDWRAVYETPSKGLG